MSLNKNQLKDDLIAMMNAAVKDPSWSMEQTAQAMADAIDTFVRTGSVSGVKVRSAELTLNQEGDVKVQ
jgi:hypothetical protein